VLLRLLSLQKSLAPDMVVWWPYLQYCAGPASKAGRPIGLSLTRSHKRHYSHADPSAAQGPKFADSLLEGDGFEPSVPFRTGLTESVFYTRDAGQAPHRLGHTFVWPGLMLDGDEPGNTTAPSNPRRISVEAPQP
jgi:hypothetical protein